MSGGELDSLNRAEVTKVKQFVSSQKDRFRASFDRRPKDYLRQVVFIGTTNEDHYLVDITGNRRFWPVRITRQIDLDWFRANRDQLFAEALSYFQAGERFPPDFGRAEAVLRTAAAAAADRERHRGSGDPLPLRRGPARGRARRERHAGQQHHGERPAEPPGHQRGQADARAAAPGHGCIAPGGLGALQIEQGRQAVDVPPA